MKTMIAKLRPWPFNLRVCYKGVVLALLVLPLCGSCLRSKTGSTHLGPPEPKPTPEVKTGSAEARYGLKFKPVDFSPPPVSHVELGNGITVDYYAEKEIPLVTVLVRLRVGSVNDPADKVGAAAMTAELIRIGGSTSLKGDELDRLLESRGAQLSSESDREETWFRLSVLKEDLEWGLGILQDVLTHPAFPEAKLDEARGPKIVELRQRLDVPQDLARALYPQMVYQQGNPWGWTTTERSLTALRIEDLRALYQKYYVSGNMKLGFAGDVTWERAQELAGRTFGRLPRQAAPALNLPEVQPINETRVYIVPREATQNVIYLGHEGINRFDPQKFPLRVFNNVLSGGFTSRLFKEIRSDRGLAYAVFGRVGEGTKKGIFINVALTKVPSTGQALELMRQIDQDLRQKDASSDEVDLAKQSDINSFVFFFDSAEKIVRQRMTLDGFGYPADYLQTYVPKLKAVTPEQVREAAAAKIHPERIVVLVVGQVDAALRAELQKLGPVTEISEAELKAKWL